MWVGTDAAPRLRPIGGLRMVSDDGAPRPTSPASLSEAPQPGSRAVGANAAVPVNPPPQSASGPTFASWSGPAQVKTGETFTVALEMQIGQPLRGLPAQLAYSKELLQLISVEEGDLFKQGGVPTSFTQSIDSQAGKATAAVLRSQASGASGRGKIAVLTFKARAAGVAEVSVVGMDPIGPAGSLPPMTALPSLSIQVQ